MNQETPHRISRLPNLLTALRAAGIPLVVLCLHFPGKTGSLLAALCFSLASLTDILDGFLARRYCSVTLLGRFLDPLADKALVLSTMVMLISLGRIAAWIVVVILIREMAVTGLRGMAAREGVVISAGPWGKLKTVLQSLAAACLCLHYTYGGVDFQKVGTWLVWVALVVTVWSGYDYFRQYSRVVRSSLQG